jgi:hypothetical protein
VARVDNRGNLRGSLQNATTSGGARRLGGADEFYRVSKALKAAGDTGLRNELNKAVRAAAKPLVPKVRAAAREKLPKKGGLNERIAKKPYRAQTRTGVNTAGVRIVGTKVDPRINAQGRIQHPVFGRPGSTVVQFDQAARGYFDETLQQAAPQVQEDVVAVVRLFHAKLLQEMTK